MMIFVLMLMLVLLVIVMVSVVVVIGFAMIRMLLLAEAMLKEVINPTRLIATNRSGSQRIVVTTKFDNPGGSKGRKNHFC